MASTYFSLIHLKLHLLFNAHDHDDWDIANVHDDDGVWDWDSNELDDEDWDIAKEDGDENLDWDSKQLDDKEHDADWEKKLKQYEVDVKFIETFCAYLESWDYTTTDEQWKESLRSMITHLQKIWIEDLEEEEDNLEKWQLDIEHFDPLTFGLEEKIQQSKPQIEQWCQILVIESALLLGDTVQFGEIHQQLGSKDADKWYGCPPDTDAEGKMKHFIDEQCKYLLDHMIIPSVTYCVNNLPFGKIVALYDMLSFVLNSSNVLYKCTYSKELLNYMNFVRAFFYNAACLVCLYWAKEANEGEVATEFNIALFDMFSLIKSCAAEVTACYFGVLNSNNLLQSEYTQADFVDFFFGYTILKDSFLILREQLIVLFTFLTGAPNAAAAAAEEEDVVRSQIYDLFREDAYLLLPINVMKEDFSNTMMLLNDFWIKTDNLCTKIIQLYCTPSDSWNRLEAEKMNNIYLASLQREISSILKYDKGSDTLSALFNFEVYSYLLEIRFLRLFLQCFETWDDSDEETWLRLRSVVTSLQRIWGQDYDVGLLPGHLYATRKEDNIADFKHLLDTELKEKFQMSKKEIHAWLVSLSHCSFHCRPSTSNKILNFLDSILYNMRHLVSSGTCKDDAFKKQVEIFEEKQLILTNLLKLATNCEYSKYLEEFNMLAQVFANNAACLIYMYWTKEVNKGMTNLMLSNMLQRMKPNTPDVARIYIGTLKAICLQPYDYILFEQTATNFVDYFFEDLVTPWKNDFQIFRDEFIFHLTFICHHHSGNAGEIICSQLDVLINDDVYDLLPFDDVNGNLSEKKVGLSDFMMNIATGNAKIRQLYCKFPDSFVYSFPRIIGQGFLERLIHKLKNLTERMISDRKYVPVAKYEITTIEEEMVSLTPIFTQFLELKDLNGAFLEAINVVYLAEHVISLCNIYYHLIRHYIPYLSDVIDRIKAVKSKLEKIEECNMYNISGSISHSSGYVSALLEQDWKSEMVGFEVDEKIIMDNLTRGTSLDIVSIVGMGGLGKTTLAKKIYGSSSIKSHFNIFAFVYVSQNYNKRRILVDILKDIVGVIDKDSPMTEDDLAHKLKKCLSRQKYFIVFDDIWSIKAWEAIRSSFPDDRNGSRVMFTTRYLEVAKRGQIDSSPHHLRFLTEDESLKLLQKKVFHNDMPPPNLSSLVELIAKKCSGLPLAIVAIAGLLSRTETSLWFDISKRVSSYLFDEGCINILELSYKHLPNYVKPCLLYLGAFPVNSSYRVRQVTRLWIAEGFIKESKTKSVKDVATEYLYELFDRSLITVDEMVVGEMHTFRVHDLIYDFCQKKCRDENFFHLGHEIATSGFREPSIHNHYRVSMGKQSDFNDDAKVSLANTRSILYFQFDYIEREYALKKFRFRFAQVLSLKDIVLEDSNITHMTSLIDLRHIEAEVSIAIQSIPSSISNLWNMQSLILRSNINSNSICLPESLWKMKSLTHVKVGSCKLKASDGYELNAYPQLENVVSFSRPCISSGKDVEWFLQRLPAVRELDCILDYESVVDSIEETFDFHRNLESMKLSTMKEDWPQSINFPSTLIKLKLSLFLLPWTAISAFAELRCLRILKLRYVSFPGPTWEMGDMTFPNLKYFELRGSNLELWDADIDSFPCLVQLYFHQTKLKELPPCFAEISSLRKITIWGSSELMSSALWIQEEQMDWGNKLELEFHDM